PWADFAGRRDRVRVAWRGGGGLGVGARDPPACTHERIRRLARMGRPGVTPGGKLALAPPTLDDVRAARQRLAGTAPRTPPLRLPPRPGEPEVWLKLENLQPIGSFKIRGAANTVLQLPADRLELGVFTASAGNMAQGVAWCARVARVPCTVVVPDNAPHAKL